MAEPTYGLNAASAKLLKSMANEHRQRLPDAGRRTRRVYASRACNEVTLSGCGSCQAIITDEEDLTIPIADTGLFAAESYLFGPLCGGSQLTLTWDEGEEKWISTTNPSTDCDDVSTTITVKMEATSVDAGDVTITVTGDPGTLAVYTNPVAWQPALNLTMALTGGDLTCNCSPFEPWPCLTPKVPA